MELHLSNKFKGFCLRGRCTKKKKVLGINLPIFNAGVSVDKYINLEHDQRFYHLKIEGYAAISFINGILVFPAGQKWEIFS